jgi:uncharacterized SAM-binding protein YcdF (DUF218 family)
VRRFLIVCAVALAAAFAVGVPLFVWQDDDSLPRGADAVVALSGSERTLPAAQTLVGGGIAPMLVVSAERNGRDEPRARICRTKADDVICVYGGPFATSGEAQAISRLAEDRGWDTIILVSSDVERFRLERAFQRCGDFRVATYGVDEPWWNKVVGIPLEWVKLAVSETVRRNC